MSIDRCPDTTPHPAHTRPDGYPDCPGVPIRTPESRADRMRHARLVGDQADVVLGAASTQCGDTALGSHPEDPDLMVCVLPAGHTGWHQPADTAGAEWRRHAAPTAVSPAYDAGDAARLRAEQAEQQRDRYRLALDSVFTGRDQANAELERVTAERDRAREYAADNHGVLEAVHAALERAGYQSAVHGPANGIRLLAAALNQARADRDRYHRELTAARTDLLDVRGILSPNGFPRRVPMELVPTVAPAVRWLADQLDQARAARDLLRQQLASAEAGLRAYSGQPEQIHNQAGQAWADHDTVSEPTRNPGDALADALRIAFTADELDDLHSLVVDAGELHDETPKDDPAGRLADALFVAYTKPTTAASVPVARAQEPGRRMPRIVPYAERAPLYAAYQAAKEHCEQTGAEYSDDSIIQAAVKAYEAERRAQVAPDALTEREG